MDGVQQRAGGISYAPSPPEEFCGRDTERAYLLTVLAQAGERGQAVMISGPPGIGKSSLLNRLARDVQEHTAGFHSPVLRGEVFDLPGMIFSAFREILKNLRRSVISAGPGDTRDLEGMNEAIRYADDVFEKYVAPVEPIGLLQKSGEEIIGIFARSPEVGYDRVLQAFEELLGELGRIMTGTGRIATILLNDVHLASGLDRRLLCDIVQDLPPGIFLAFTCRGEDGPGAGYAAMCEELRDTGVSEVRLSGMKRHEIRELATRRFGLSPDDATVALLEEISGNPFGLLACFNALNHRGLPLSPKIVQDTIAGAESAAGLALSALGDPARTWVERLSVLNPPFPVPIMACMLDLLEADVTLMAERMQEVGILRELTGDGYAFSHPLLQEHCRQELSPGAKVALNARAAECFEGSIHRLSGRLHVLLSLACHLFYAREYGKALDLNLELSVRFYHREDYDTALMLTERAIIAGERLGDGALLAAAKRQGDLVRQKVAAPPRTAR